MQCPFPKYELPKPDAEQTFEIFINALREFTISYQYLFSSGSHCFTLFQLGIFKLRTPTIINIDRINGHFTTYFYNSIVDVTVKSLLLKSVLYKEYRQKVMESLEKELAFQRKQYVPDPSLGSIASFSISAPKFYAITIPK